MVCHFFDMIRQSETEEMDAVNNDSVISSAIRSAIIIPVIIYCCA